MADPDAPERPTIGPAAKLVIVALAAFGLVMLVQWVLGFLVGLAKFAIFVVVVVAMVYVVRSVISRR